MSIALLSTRRLAFAVIVIVVATTMVVPAGAQQAYEPVQPDFTAREAATVYQGIVDGTAYAIEVPDNWGGRLVLYAHGFVGSTDADLVVQEPPLRDAFLAAGYAWAASSYSANGYVVDTAVDETHDLIGRVQAATGTAPTQVLITGFSLGGHVTVASIERYRDSYAGAMPLCGVLGDTELFEYFSDNILAGAAEAGIAPVYPPMDYLTSNEPAQLVEQLGLGNYSGLTGAGYRYANVVEELSGGERPVFEEGFSFWYGEDTAAAGYPFLVGLYGGALTGGVPDPRNPALVSTVGQTFGYFTTAKGELTSSPASMRLNDSVLRQAADPGADPYYPVVEGDPSVPVLSLHTLGDLFVPFSMDQVYAAEAEANGVGDNVVVRAIRDVGHCAFSAEELVTAWTDFLAWVNAGVKPEGDRLDPAVVRERHYGCEFTTGQTQTRPLVAPCPDAATTERAMGEDRYSTAVAISQRVHPEGADEVFLARGDLPVDALTAAPVAGTEAPILLSRTGGLPADVAADVAAEIARLGASSVTLLGGEAALSADVFAEVQAIAGVTDVTRVGGANRYETAELLAELTDPTILQVYLVSGEGTSDADFADAVAVSALAAHTGVPIVLSNFEGDTIPEPSRQTLGAREGGQITVIGGDAAVSDREEDAAVAAMSATNPTRLAGANRYGTSAAIADRALRSGLELNDPWIATGRRAADALVAGPAAATQGQILLLVDGTRGPSQATVDFLSEHGALVSSFIVAGGTSAVTAEVADALVAVVASPQE